jgi:hypothetical protein
MSLTMLDLNGDARRQTSTYSMEPVSRPPRVWIGFLLAFGFLMAEIVDVNNAKSSETHGFTIIVGLIGWLYWLSCVQRFHTILNQISPHVGGEPTYPIKPGQAVWSHFIPFYNIVWIFKWPRELALFLETQTSVKILSGELLGFLFLVSMLVFRLFDGFIGLTMVFTLGVYISRRLREAVAFHEQTRVAASTFA